MQCTYVSTFLVQACGSVLPNMSALTDLPFPLTELSWEKFPIVREHLQLSKIETYTIMSHVLGDKPKDPKLYYARHAVYIYRQTSVPSP